MEIEFTYHVYERQLEREVSEEQILDTIQNPTAVRPGRDGTTLYYREIKVSDGARVPKGRYLLVVMNDEARPRRVVSVFPRREIR